MISDRRRGRDRDRNSGRRGCGFVRCGYGSYGGRQSASEKGHGNIRIVDVAITSPKSAKRNLDVLSGHIYLSLVLLPHVILLKIVHL